MTTPGGRTDPERVRAWLAEGTAVLLGEVDRVEAAAAQGGGPTADLLPGWGLTHVLAHVACNAQALTRLLAWARSGVETPMYASGEARSAEIEAGAKRSVAENAAHARTSAAELDAAIASMPEEAWAARVRTAQGREVPAWEVLWMRTREVWVHAVDLDGTTGFGDLPPDLLEALVADVLFMFSRRGEMAGLTVAADDAELVASVTAAPDGGGSPSTTVRGRLADLAAWLTGRGDASPLRTEDGEPVPALPRWL